MVHSQARLNGIFATDLRMLPSATSHDGSLSIVRRTAGCRGTLLSVLSQWGIKMSLGILTVQMVGKPAAFRSKKPNLLRQMTSRVQGKFCWMLRAKANTRCSMVLGTSHT